MSQMALTAFVTLWRKCSLKFWIALRSNYCWRAECSSPLCYIDSSIAASMCRIANLRKPLFSLISSGLFDWHITSVIKHVGCKITRRCYQSPSIPHTAVLRGVQPRPLDSRRYCRAARDKFRPIDAIAADRLMSRAAPWRRHRYQTSTKQQQQQPMSGRCCCCCCHCQK